MSRYCLHWAAPELWPGRPLSTQWLDGLDRFGKSNQCPGDWLVAEPGLGRCCYILTFWPGQKCHSKVMHRKEVTHSNGSYERKSRGRKLADEIGRAKKFPWYTHRLMHQKRVTCELHDSYFRLMTIKHSISKIEWAIEWALNYYITQLNSSSNGRWNVVGKATPGRRGLGPWWIGVQRRCW